MKQVVSGRRTELKRLFEPGTSMVCLKINTDGHFPFKTVYKVPVRIKHHQNKRCDSEIRCNCNRFSATDKTIAFFERPPTSFKMQHKVNHKN